MNDYPYLKIVAGAACAAAAVYYCLPTATPKQTASLTNIALSISRISLGSAAALYHSGRVVFVDATPAGSATLKIQGAVGVDESNALIRSIRQSKDIGAVVVYCQTGCGAAEASVHKLETELNLPVHIFQGGLKDWMTAGLPYETIN